MAKFKVGDEVVVTEAFKGNAREFVGQTGVLRNHPFKAFDFHVALGGDEKDLLAVNEEEIAHV